MATTTVEEASTDGGAKGAPVWEKGAGPAGGGESGHTRTVCFSSGNPRMESTRVMHRNTTPDSGSADQLPIAIENHHRLTTQLETEKQVNQIHLDNQKRRQQKFKERKERGTAKIKERDDQITNLEKQVRDLMYDLEAPKMRESSADAAELGEGTILPHSVSITTRNHPASNNIQPQTSPAEVVLQAISEIKKKERRSRLQKSPKDVKDSEIEKKERRSLLQNGPKDVKNSEIEKKEPTWPEDQSIVQRARDHLHKYICDHLWICGVNISSCGLFGWSERYSLKDLPIFQQESRKLLDRRSKIYSLRDDPILQELEILKTILYYEN